ncbi:HD domain-containing protein [bacterium]|nr:HD domain-containing protein [bacterium]
MSDDFWSAPTSSSGRYHPPESNIEPAGLLAHIVKALEVADGLFSYYGVKSEIDKDIVNAALLLHDSYKGGPTEKWSSMDPAHGKFAKQFFKDIELDEYIKSIILDCIETHMSRWARPLKSSMAGYTPTKLQRIVSLSDFIASRKKISFYPGLKIVDDE